LKNFGEPCVLEDRSCTECGECDLCDLDPTKQCDNCCQCVETLECDFVEIGIDDILVNTEDPNSDRHLETAEQVPRLAFNKIGNKAGDFSPLAVFTKKEGL
jgi:hypothetical protein